MSIPIINANTRPIGSFGFMPTMRHALSNWLRPMTGIAISKVIGDDGFVVETPTSTDFQGCLQPYPNRKLKMKPQGQWGWKWWTLYTTADIGYKLDDEFTVDGRKFRVMSDQDFMQADFYQYDLVEDYQ